MRKVLNLSKKACMGLFLFIQLLLGSNSFAQTLTIGTETNAGVTYPITRTYDYGTDECLYLAAELGPAGTITAIAYEKLNVDDGLNITGVTVYMKHTTATSLGSGTFSTSGYTTVFSGTVTNSSAAGWKTITLSTPFSYNGTDNLLIAIDKGYQAASGTPANWYYSATSPNMNRRSYGAAPNTFLTSTAGRQNTRFTGLSGPSAPANNDCSGAIALTVNTSCSYVAGSSYGATQSLSGCTGNADDDVWYKFVATATTATISVAGNSDYDPAFELRSGACNGTQIAGSCTDWGGTGGTETYAASGLTIGTTYYIRVWDYAAGAGTFNICVYSTAAGGPSNDDCSGAITLTPNSSCSYTSGTSQNATSSGIGACSGNADDDVWYKFVATATTHTITVAPSAGYDAAFDLRGPGACNGTYIACKDGPGNGGTETMVRSGLTVGQTYYVRVWEYLAGSGSNTFNICVIGTSCGVSISFQPQSACAAVGGSASFSVTASGSPTYQWEVNTGSGWSSISAPGSSPTYSGYTTNKLTLTGIVSGNNNYQYRVVCTNACSVTSTSAVLYVSGAGTPTATAATGVSTYQFNSNWGSVTGATGYYLDVAWDNTFTNMVPGWYNLDVGNVTTKTVNGLACSTPFYYRVRAYNSCGASANSNTITVTTSSCTSNNECTTATNLTVGTGASCSSPWYSTLGATQSAEPVCTGQPDDDVWFKFTAPTATVIVDVGSSYNFDGAFEVFSGVCGALTSMGCTDAKGLYGAESAIFTTLTPGTVYYIRVYNWRFGAGNGAFTICLSNPHSQAMTNDAAASAITLPNTNIFPRNATEWHFYNTTGSTNSSEPALPTAWTASLVSNQTTWYKFTATTSAQMVATQWNHTFGYTGTNNRLAIYTAGMSQIASNEDHTVYYNPGVGGDYQMWYYSGGYGFSAVTATGLTPGTTYYVRVDAPGGILSIATQPAPTNDACSDPFVMAENVQYFVDNSGSVNFSNNNIPDAVFSCTGSESTENLLYYTFTPATTDLYYINQWGQYCEIGYGTQFIIFNPGIDCSTIPTLYTGVDASKQFLCSASSMANRSYSMTLTAGSTYYIIIDGGQSDECQFFFAISKGVPVPMPVELVQFDVHCLNGKVMADWTTASETNCNYFSLERSENGQDFIEVNKVKGAGNSSSAVHYSLEDPDGQGKKYFYRLRQVDFNGDQAYSNAKSNYCFSDEQELNVFPNPAENFTDVYFELEQPELVRIDVRNSIGEVVRHIELNGNEGYNSVRVELHGLNIGVYQLSVVRKNSLISKRLLVH